MGERHTELIWPRQGKQKKYDVIIIGSGIGGTVAGALLAKNQRKVLVLEKNETPGGIMASYYRDGFKIDKGSHLIARGKKGPLGWVLRDLGLNSPRFITHDIPSTSRGIFECRLPKHRYQLLAFSAKAARDLRIPPKDIAKLTQMLIKILTMNSAEMREWDNRTLDEFLLQYTDYPPAYFLFAFLMSIFFVLPPWHTSAGESLYSLRPLLMEYNLSYIEGGMDSYVNTLLHYVESRDGEAVVGEKVVDITRNGSIFKVFTENGNEYQAPVVIANMLPRDALSLFSEKPDEAGYEEYYSKAINIKPAMNAYQVKFGLKRPLIKEGSFIGGVSLNGIGIKDLSFDLLRKTTEAVMAGKISDPLSVYAPVPTNYDPSLAPPGKQLVVASVYGPIRNDPVDPPEKWKEYLIKLFASIIPHLEDELLFYEFTNIPDVGSWMGKSNNGAISNGQYPDQVGDKRLPVKTPIKNFYICGDGAGGRGIGTELSAISAMEAVAHILKG